MMMLCIHLNSSQTQIYLPGLVSAHGQGHQLLNKGSAPISSGVKTRGGKERICGLTDERLVYCLGFQYLE
jgi:hypothetical protein